MFRLVVLPVLRALGGPVAAWLRSKWRPRARRHPGPVHLFKRGSWSTWCGRNYLVDEMLGSSLYTETTCQDCRRAVHVVEGGPEFLPAPGPET